MAKKIFDIIPPEEHKITQEIERKEEKKEKSFSLFWWILLGILIAGGGLYFLVGSFAKASVDLVLNQHSVQTDQEVESNINQLYPDFQNNVIPGKIFQSQEEETKNFKATGKDFKEAKAQGVIRVYNKTIPAVPLSFRANTRFLSSQGGKIFVCPKKIYIPPAKKQGSEIIPGSVDINVVAQEPGEEYNIAPSKFSVPGLVGTDYYFTVWGESKEKMKGGFKKEVAKVTSEDLKKAEESIKSELENVALDNIKSKLPTDFMVVDQSIAVDSFNFSCTKKEGDLADNFNCTGNIKLRAFGFKINDLKEMMSHFLQKDIPSTEVIRKDSVGVKYQPESVDLDSGKVVLRVNGYGRSYKPLDERLITEQIEGKNIEDIKRVVYNNYPQVQEVRVSIWPFWRKEAPVDSSKIKINISFTK